MGEIIHFDFNKGKRLKKETDLPECPKKEEKEPKKMENLPVRFAKFLISENAKKIMNLSATREAYAQAEKTVKSYSTRELISWLEESEEEDWRVKPSFYRTMIEELKTRYKNPKKEEWEITDDKDK